MMSKNIDKSILSLISKHNKTHDVNLYTQILDMFDAHRERSKCRCCGGEIYYSNTWIKTHRDGTITPEATSYMTTKDMFGHEYHLGICEECLLKEFPELKTKNLGRQYNRPTKYTAYAFSIPDDIINKKNIELCSRTIDSMISKHGEDEGRRRWNEYVERQRYTNTYEYKHEVQGFTEDDFEKYNKSRACTLSNLIQRYGEKEGKKRWDEYVYKQMYTTTLEYFVERYGDVEGREKWDSYNNARLSNKSYSYISQELFNKISEDPEISQDALHYMTLNGEYCIHIKDMRKLYYLDFYDETLSICIEFNGNRFHPKPGDYHEGDMFKNIYNGELIPVDVYWERERERKELLKKIYNIDTIIVWEDEYKKDKDNIILKLRNILNEKRHAREV